MFEFRCLSLWDESFVANASQSNNLKSPTKLFFLFQMQVSQIIKSKSIRLHIFFDKTLASKLDTLFSFVSGVIDELWPCCFGIKFAKPLLSQRTRSIQQYYHLNRCWTWLSWVLQIKASSSVHTTYKIIHNGSHVSAILTLAIANNSPPGKNSNLRLKMGEQKTWLEFGNPVVVVDWYLLQSSQVSIKYWNLWCCISK